MATSMKVCVFSKITFHTRIIFSSRTISSNSVLTQNILLAPPYCLPHRGLPSSLTCTTLRQGFASFSDKKKTEKPRPRPEVLKQIKDTVLDYREADVAAIPIQVHNPDIHHGPNIDVEQETERGSVILNAVNTEIQAEAYGRLFAIIHMDGQQYKITNGDIILLDGNFSADIGDRIRIEKVLLVGSNNWTVVGRPLISKDFIHVDATVVEKSLSHWIYWMIWHRRFGFKYRRRHMARNAQTMLRINSITVTSTMQGGGIPPQLF